MVPPYLSINLHDHYQHYMCGHREPPRQEGGHIYSPIPRSSVLVKAGSNERSFLGPHTVKCLIIWDVFFQNSRTPFLLSLLTGVAFWGLLCDSK
jgi:hypothetical protein